MSHQFVGLLTGRIQVHRLLLRGQQIAVADIHRAAGGVHQVLKAVVLTTLQHMAETHQVALDVAGLSNEYRTPACATKFSTTCWRSSSNRHINT